MFKFFIKISLITYIIVMLSWIPLRQQVDKHFPEMIKSYPVYILDVIVTSSINLATPLIGKDYTDNLLKNIRPDSFINKIIEATPQQVVDIIEVTKAHNKQILLYIYSLDCQLCKTNFEDINNIGSEYKDKGLITIAIAIDDDSIKLGTFLDNQYTNISFRPLMLRTKDEQELVQQLRLIGVRFSKAPYITIAGKSGRFLDIAPGFIKETKIRQAVIDATSAN